MIDERIRPFDGCAATIRQGLDDAISAQAPAASPTFDATHRCHRTRNHERSGFPARRTLYDRNVAESPFDGVRRSFSIEIGFEQRWRKRPVRR